MGHPCQSVGSCCQLALQRIWRQSGPKRKGILKFLSVFWGREGEKRERERERESVCVCVCVRVRVTSKNREEKGIAKRGNSKLRMKRINSRNGGQKYKKMNLRNE